MPPSRPGTTLPPLSVVSAVASVVGLLIFPAVFVPSLIGVVTGTMAYSEIRDADAARPASGVRVPRTGALLSVGGIVVGILGLALGVIIWVEHG